MKSVCCVYIGSYRDAFFSFSKLIYVRQYLVVSKFKPKNTMLRKKSLCIQLSCVYRTNVKVCGKTKSRKPRVVLFFHFVREIFFFSPALFFLLIFLQPYFLWKGYVCFVEILHMRAERIFSLSKLLFVEIDTALAVFLYTIYTKKEKF